MNWNQYIKNATFSLYLYLVALAGVLFAGYTIRTTDAISHSFIWAVLLLGTLASTVVSFMPYFGEPTDRDVNWPKMATALCPIPLMLTTPYFLFSILRFI